MRNDFLIENKESFEKLALKIRTLDTVFTKPEEVIANQKAIEIVLSWVEELWGIKRNEFNEFYQETTKENDMFKYRDAEE